MRVACHVNNAHYALPCGMRDTIGAIRNARYASSTHHAMRVGYLHSASNCVTAYVAFPYSSTFTRSTSWATMFPPLPALCTLKL
jgi:hypothetical protein